MEQKRNNNFLNTLLTLLVLVLAGVYLWDRFGATPPDVSVVLEDIGILDAATPTFATQPAPTPVPLVEFLQSTPTPTAEWMGRVDAGATADTIVATPDSAGVYAYETELGGTLWTYLNAEPVIALPTPMPTQPAWALPPVTNLLVSPTPVCKPPLACAANTPTP